MARVQGGQASDPPGDFSRAGRWPDWAASPLCRPGTSLCLCPQPGVLALDVPCPSGSPALGAVPSAVRVLNLRAATELPHLGNGFCHLVSRGLGSEDRECNCGSSTKAMRGRPRDTGTLPSPTPPCPYRAGSDPASALLCATAKTVPFLSPTGPGKPRKPEHNEGGK